MGNTDSAKVDAFRWCASLIFSEDVYNGSGNGAVAPSASGEVGNAIIAGATFSTSALIMDRKLDSPCESQGIMGPFIALLFILHLYLLLQQKLRTVP